MNDLQQTLDILQTLEHIELLALSGQIGNPLTAMTARLLTLEITHSETSLDAVQRAQQFIEDERVWAVGKVG